MKPNTNPNFLDSATHYWASKLKFMKKSNPSSDQITPSLQPANNAYFPPTNTTNFFPSPNVFNQPQNIPQVISPIPQQQPNFYAQTNVGYPPVGIFQNLAPPQQYPHNVKMLPSMIEGQNNFYPPPQNYYYPYQNHNENVFGAVLNKANNFWQCSPQSTQSHNIPRPQFYYPPGFHSDPISRDRTSSNLGSEPFSWEASFNKPNFEENFQGRMTQQLPLQKKIKKKYNRKNKKGKNPPRNNDSVSIAKKLLAIANNWQEVCKKVPEGVQSAFKEKMKRYLKRKILPDLELKTKIQQLIHNKDSSLEADPQSMSFHPTTNEAKESNEINEMDKFDEIFGKDLDRILQRNNDERVLDLDNKAESNGFGWHPPGGFNQHFELESPTLSKILKQDGLSINYDFKEKDNANDFEMKSIFFDKNENKQEEELILLDSIINEKKANEIEENKDFG